MNGCYFVAQLTRDTKSHLVLRIFQKRSNRLEPFAIPTISEYDPKSNVSPLSLEQNFENAKDSRTTTPIHPPSAVLINQW